MLIETLPAAFEMDEILWELRDHSAGLNCGRWDYIFSFIKTLREDPAAVMPDRWRPLIGRCLIRTQMLVVPFRWQKAPLISGVQFQWEVMAAASGAGNA